MLKQILATGLILSATTSMAFADVSTTITDQKNHHIYKIDRPIQSVKIHNQQKSFYLSGDKTVITVPLSANVTYDEIKNKQLIPNKINPQSTLCTESYSYVTYATSMFDKAPGLHYSDTYPDFYQTFSFPNSGPATFKNVIAIYSQNILLLDYQFDLTESGDWSFDYYPAYTLGEINVYAMVAELYVDKEHVNIGNTEVQNTCQ